MRAVTSQFMIANMLHDPPLTAWASQHRGLYLPRSRRLLPYFLRNRTTSTTTSLQQRIFPHMIPLLLSPGANHRIKTHLSSNTRTTSLLPHSQSPGAIYLPNTSAIMRRSSGNKSSSGSPTSVLDAMEATQNSAAQRVREAPPAPATPSNEFTSVYDGDNVILDNHWGFTPPPHSSNSPPQQGLGTNASPSSQNAARQGTLRQGSPSHDVAPPQNTRPRGDSETRGRRNTQSPAAGLSTQSGSQGGNNLRLNVQPLVSYQNLANRSRSGTGTPNTPITTQSPVPPAFYGMQATGSQFHGHAMPQSASLTRSAAQSPVPPAVQNMQVQ